MPIRTSGMSTGRLKKDSVDSSRLDTPALTDEIHAVGVPGIHDRPGGQPLDDRDRLGGPVTEDHVDAADPGGLKQADDPFKDRHLRRVSSAA